MSGRVRVLVFVTAAVAGTQAVEDAYHRISRGLAGTPGLLGNELLRSEHDRDGFVVLSEWRDLDAFRAWEEGESHRSTTAPLRPLQDRSRGASFGVYTVQAEYSGRSTAYAEGR
ncbi:antibiotic biosynthesis monooxygenase [Nonomuraea sp. KC401]|uniref:antibiotic biosynthesis monooxygenase family protein n=1 Tax=unclassified Nonomuraea TaxID=2593643 RepID=UPI0010FDD7C1|nr:MULTISPECIES: antibiotic biosynthesis monooxygenase [unclassified Nonomuraea]NBE93735.1 antibiotic biosynthesis monooxygenase [Nonomuraea sp. K271]TLF76998.1 antibiotic biosynthesis monooxygenase [Nonomuraea sp. KC401]